MEDGEPSSIFNSPSSRLSGLGGGCFLLPGALGGLGNEAFLDGAGGHAHVTDFAVGHERLDALDVHPKLALGDGGDVCADTAGFLGFTRAPDNAALHRAFAGDFTNA